MSRPLFCFSAQTMKSPCAQIATSRDFFTPNISQKSHKRRNVWNFVAFNRESGVGNQDSGHKNGRIQFESFEKIIEDYFQTRLCSFQCHSQVALVRSVLVRA